jgi:beta-ribofuranosylaminobenzene 5'-phosphate synthase
MKTNKDAASESCQFELKTGCRLHFGLMELSGGAEHQYAGLGVMLDQPSMRLRVDLLSKSPGKILGQIQDGSEPSGNSCSYSPASDDSNFKEYEQRIELWLRKIKCLVHVELTELYPFHSGLGTGTQLSCLMATIKHHCSTARSLDSQWRTVAELYPELQPSLLAEYTGRGKRSAIGLHGFLYGGCLLDFGQQPSAKGDQRHASRFTLPSEWRFVLVRPQLSSGITGEREHSLLRRVSERPNPTRAKMWALAGEVQRAAVNADFPRFANRLEDYLAEANQLFAPVQGGNSFNGTDCQQAVEMAKQAGLRATGQSSWGPTIFGVSPNNTDAQRSAAQIAERKPDWYVQVSAVASQGAVIRLID